MAIESIQLKLSNLEYLNREESILLFDFLFNNKLTQLEFNHILNSINLRTFNNKELFSCVEVQTLNYYLNLKTSLEFTTISKLNAGRTPTYYTLNSSINSSFNVELFIALILGAYFTYKKELTKLAIYDIKYNYNSCKSDFYNILNSIAYQNVIISDNNVNFLDSYSNLTTQYTGNNALKVFLTLYKTYTTKYPLKKYILSNNSSIKNYYSNQFNSNIEIFNSSDNLFSISSDSVIEKIENYQWIPENLITAYSILENQFDFTQDYNSLILQGLTKDYINDPTEEFYIEYILLLGSVILSQIYNLSIDEVYEDVSLNMLNDNKFQEYITTGTIL